MIRAVLSVLVGSSVVLALASCGEVSNGVSAADDPTIVSLAPDHGPADGGITVTVTGSGFSGDAVVVVDGVSAKDAMVANSTTVTFTLPPGLEGHKVDVEVSTSKGYATSTAAFRYNLRPVILSISPALGRFAGGTSVTIIGRGFQVDEADVPTVTIGGSAATSVQIVDDKTITATTAAADPSVLAFVATDISLANKNGVTTQDKAFTLTKQGILVNAHGNQYFVDPTTKAVAQLTQMQQQNFSGCSLGPNGKTYSKRRRSDGAWELYDYDPITHDINIVGVLMASGTPFDVSSLTFLGNSLYLASRRMQQFFSVNTTTGAATAVGAVNAFWSSSHPSLAPKDSSTLWAATSTTGNLYTVNVATGATTIGPAFTGVAVSQQLGALVLIGGQLYASTVQTFPSTVYKVNTTTGALTQFASIPNNVNGMCQTPSVF